MTPTLTASDFGGWRTFAKIGAIALIILLAMTLRVDLLKQSHPEFSGPKDHHKYIHMAEENLLDFHVAPFCWRVGEPFLVRLLPMDTQAGFFTVAIVSLWLSGLLMFYLARRLGSSQVYALIAMLLFYYLGYASYYPLRNFWMSDALSFVFILLALHAIVGRRDWLFLLALTLGVTVRESVILVAPVYYTWSAKGFPDWRRLGRFLLLTFPALAVLLGLRLTIPALNDDPAYLASLPEKLSYVHRSSSSYDLPYLWRTFGLPRITGLNEPALMSYTVRTWGVLVLFLPLFAIRRNRELFARLWPLVFLAYAQILLAANTQRLLVIAFPAMILMSLNGIETLRKLLLAAPRDFILLPVLMILLNLVNRRHVFGDFDSQAIIFLAYLAVLIYRWRGRVSAAGDGELGL